jgi:hypothetical protein
MMAHFEEIKLHFQTYGQHTVNVPDEESDSSSDEEEPPQQHYIPLRDGEHNSPTSTNPETPGKPHVPGLDFSGVNGNGKQLTLPRDLAFQLYLTLKDEFEPATIDTSFRETPIPQLPR